MLNIMDSSYQVETVYVADLELLAFKNMSDAVEYILNDEGIHHGFAAAINAEKIVKSLSDAKVKALLGKATIRYADGIAVVHTMRKKGVLCERIPGCELWYELLMKSVKYETPVYIVGASKDVNRLTVAKLLAEGVNIKGYSDGYFSDITTVIEDILIKKPSIITVAMGSPRQEEFIERCRNVWPNAFYMGVGGTYDVFVGKVKRAPKWMQEYHLEWLYRLIIEPTRVFRQVELFKYLLLHLRNRV
jgi:UDP-N-acetyl-D-mannosaminouronate:lipid I N-acetyl-D-mannosaminouronosyltransferase